MTKNNQKSNNQVVSSIGLIFLIDISLTAISFIASYMICTSIWPELGGQKILIQLPVIIAISSLLFLFIGYSKGVVKYDRTKEVYSIFNAICLANILTIVLVVIHSKVVTNNENSFLIPLSIIIVHSFLSFISLIASRFLFKAFHNSFLDEPLTSSRVLLGGSIKDAKKIIDAFGLSSSTIGEYSIAGFVSLDENVTSQTSVGSVLLICKDELDEKLLKNYKISQFVVCKTTNFDKGTNDFLLKLSTLPLKIKIARIDLGKTSDEKVDSSLEIKEVHNLRIADLYVSADLELESHGKESLSYFNNKKVLVIGAAGCVGNELVKKLGRLKYESILLLDKSEDALFKLEQEFSTQKIINAKTLLGDILDKTRLEKIFADFSPDIVVNAAGYKIFDFTKDNLYEAVRLNILGNKIVSDLAVRHGVEKYINLSRNLPLKFCTYTRATERVGEIYLNCLNAESKTQFVNIRFGNVLESKSSVMNVFKRQLESGGPIKISSKEALISFISVDELADLIVEAILLGKGGDIFEIQMGEPTKEIDLAKRMLRLSQSHITNHIEIVEAQDLNETEPMCRLSSNKSNSTTVQFNSNRKFIWFKEDKFEESKMKNKINELCVANSFFDENITVLMDKILRYDVSPSALRQPKYVTSNANTLERKINPLAV